MQVIPIKTRVLTPPQDDLLTVIDEYLTDVQEGDIIAISSKVVALHEGRCVPQTEVNKEDLVEVEADFIIPRPYWNSPLTVTKHAFLGAAGIDESNGGGYLVLLPQDSFVAAKRYQEYLKAKFNLTNLGVLVTDSHSTPFRYGATGVALGWYGFRPIEDHRGRKDLFLREIQYERSNLADGLAAAATVVAGEVDECVPLVVLRDVPRVVFQAGDTKDDLFVPYTEDTFRVLYEKWLE
ncbi:MAG: hypothetical protein UW75_C0026G0004 [Parcubacteria group bacterium GW2011_GWF2_44_8]|nr:MAG: hypothetical protein UW75_C0026G0004 [Parcubacteria group bacterium GW2011_GWF2_44_8]